MKKLHTLFALSIIISSFLSLSCTFYFEGNYRGSDFFNMPQYPTHDNFSYLTIDGQNFYKKSDMNFEGSVNATSDEKGIHVAVTLEKDKKYDLITLYKNENGKETIVGEISPVDLRYHYMDNEDVPVGDSIIKGETETNSEISIDSSYRTNYLSAGVHTFDLLFVEPGKTYIFYVAARESEGYFKNVTNGTSGKYRTLDNPLDEYRSSSYVVNHFAKCFQVTTDSNYKAPAINVAYNKETDEYKFAKTDFVSLNLPFKPESNEDINFGIALKYKNSSLKNDSSDKDGTFDLSYVNSDKDAVYNLSPIIEVMKEPDYKSAYEITESKVDFSYVDHFGKKYSECTTNELKVDYYKTWYGLNSYKYNDINCDVQSLPNNIIIPDNRMKLNVTATENGNVIKFKLLSNASKVTFYDFDTKKEIGKMEGNFTTEKEYTFTDYLAAPEKNAAYYATWNKRISADASVQTLKATKYYPTKAVSTFDEETMIYTLTENPFKDCLPDGFNGRVSMDYINNDNSYSFDYYDFSEPEKDVSGDSYYKQYSGKTFDISSSMKVGYRGNVGDISYENIRNVDSTYDLVKSIKFKKNYDGPEEDPSDPSTDPDSDNNDNEEYVDEDFSSYRDEVAFTEKYYKEKCPDVVFINKSDLPKITGIVETSEGAEISIYVPTWLNNLQIERTKYVKEEGDSNSHVSYINDNSDRAHYIFNMDTFQKGNIKVMDYCYEKGVNYSYTLTLYGYGSSDNSYNDYKYLSNYYLFSLTKENISVSVVYENETSYSLSKLPQVTVNNKSVELENTYLKWEKLPADYKPLSEYDGSHTTLELKSKRFIGKNNRSCYVSYYKKGQLNKKDYGTENVTYYCYDIDTSEFYYKDEYGNTVERSFTDKERTFTYTISNLEYPSWSLINNSNIYSNEAPKTHMKGKYEVRRVGTGMYDQNGIWTYTKVKLADSITNKNFEIK